MCSNPTGFAVFVMTSEFSGFLPSLRRCSGYRPEGLGFGGSQVWQPTVLQVYGELSITSFGREGGVWVEESTRVAWGSRFNLAVHDYSEGCRPKTLNCNPQFVF